VKCLIYQFFVSVVHRQISWPSLGISKAQNGATKRTHSTRPRRGLKFITDTSSKTEEGLYRLLETHIIKPLREQSYIHVEKDGRKKRVYLDDHGRDALRYSPTQRSNDLIAGLRVARAPVRVVLQGRLGHPASQTLYMNAQNCGDEVRPCSVEKPSVACGRWSLSKVVTHVGRLTGDQAVIVPIIIVSRLCRPDRLTKESEVRGSPNYGVADWSNAAVESNNGSEQHCSYNLVGRLDSYLATELLLTR